MTQNKNASPFLGVVGVILLLWALGVLMSGCGPMHQGAMKTTGDAYVTGFGPSVVVHSLTNTYMLVISNTDEVDADVVVNGDERCLLPPRATCTIVVKASRLSGRNSRADFLVVAYATSPDGKTLFFSRKTSFYSGSQPKTEVDNVKVRFPGLNSRRRAQVQAQER